MKKNRRSSFIFGNIILIMKTESKATPKQKIAFSEVLKGSTISGAMLKAGYSPTTASTTGKLTNTLGWHELMDKMGLSDKELVKRHREQLNASRHVKLYFDVDDDDALIESVCKKLGVELLFIKVSRDRKGKTANVKAPDFFYRDLALDKAYKVKGRYNDKAEDPGTKVLIINISKEVSEKHGLA